MVGLAVKVQNIYFRVGWDEMRGITIHFYGQAVRKTTKLAINSSSVMLNNVGESVFLEKIHFTICRQYNDDY